MASQQFQQPSRKRKDSGVYDDESSSPLAEPSVPKGSPEALARSRSAGGTLSNIDDVLADQERNPGGFYKPSGSGDEDSKSDSKDKLSDKEKGGAAEGSAAEGGKGSTDGGAGSLLKGIGAASMTPMGKAASLLVKNKKKAAAGGGAIGIIAVVVIALLSSLLPLKINHIVENLQAKAFATSTQAVGEETDNLISGYFQRHVIAGLNGRLCNSTKVSKSCVAPINGTSPVALLYSGWQQNRVENRLANEFGIELGRDSSGRIYMKAPGLPNNGIDIGDLGSSAHPTIFDYPQVSRSETRLAIKNATRDMTLWDRVMFRYKVGRIAQEKYGIRRCLIYCDLRDTFSDKAASKKAAFKAMLVERVIEPRSVNLASAVKCLIEPSCHPEDRTTDPSNATDATNGEADSDFEREVRSNLNISASSFGSKKLDELAKVLTDIQTNHNGSFTDYFLTTVLAKMGVTEATSQVISKAIPIIGWINFAAEAIAAVHDSGPKIKALTYAINVASYVQVYMMYRTVADEVKVDNGHPHMDVTELGSFVTSTGSGAQDGGVGAGAESSPLYSNIMGTQTTQTALLDTIFPKAYAATTTKNTTTVICDDGNGIPAGKLICPEEDLRHNNSIASAALVASKIVPPPLPTIAALWNSTFGKLLSLIGGLPCTLLKPICDQFSGLIDAIAAPLFSWVVNHFFQTVVTTNMAGSRAFTAAAGGAFALGKENCQHQLGCQEVSPAEYASLTQSEEDDAKQTFQNQSFAARMFDTNSRYSLVSRLAMAMPSSMTEFLGSGFASLLGNPLNKLSTGFSSMFVTPHAFAAITCTGTNKDACNPASAFGITLVGYPKGTIPKDPETYWDKNCADGTQTAKWNEEAINNIDPDTGQAVNTNNNPCLLIGASAASSGALFTDKVLTDDDKYGTSGGGSAATNPPPTSTTGWYWPAKNSFHAGPCWNSYVAGNGYHAGMDMNSDAPGNSAIAAHDGTVVVARPVASDAAGKYVTVKTNDPTPIYYSYEHLDSIAVSVGDNVVGGQTVIGVIGTTGNAPSNEGHLHFVTAVSNTIGSYSSGSQVGTDTRDPMDYLPRPAPYNYKCTN